MASATAVEYSAKIKAGTGNAHLQTRVYPDGISYITKLLRKYGYLEVA